MDSPRDQRGVATGEGRGEMNLWTVTDGWFRCVVRADSAEDAIDYAAAHDLRGCDWKTLRATRK
jgi:hypothetical protein